MIKIAKDYFDFLPRARNDILVTKRGVAVAIFCPKFTNFCAILDFYGEELYPTCNTNSMTYLVMRIIVISYHVR